MKNQMRKLLVITLMVMTMLCFSQIMASAKMIIVLDPGHGGSEAGARRTWSGVTYKEEIFNQKIANYLKAELQKYDGVTVYMTRTSTSQKAQDRKERLLVAKNKNADVLISLHNNATADNKNTKITGNTTCVPSTKKDKDAPARTANDREARELGAAIRAKLTSMCGLKNNGPWYDDELGIIKYGRVYNIPSLIVEHCYLSNPNDCTKHLQTEAQLKAMALADAAGIAEYYGLVKNGDSTSTEESSGFTGWKKSGSYYYYYIDNVKQAGITEINGSLYFLDNSGKRRTGFRKLNGKQYYADSKGKLLTGWQTYKKKKYYFSTKTGAAASGKVKIGKYEYYFNKSTNVMKTKWVTVSGKKYYFSKVNGKMLKSYWLKYSKKWYYLGSDGAMLKDTTAKIDGKTYTFNSKGVCTNKK